MKKIYGKQVYSTLKEVVDPRHTAILVIDMQKDYCSKGGYLDKAGIDLTNGQKTLPRVIKLVDEGRKNGVKIVWIQNTTLKDGLSDSPAWLYLKAKAGLSKPVPYTLEGDWGQEFVEGLVMKPGEPLIKKHRSSAFVSTDLDLILRSLLVESVICAGTITGGCVMMTALNAMHYNYYTVVARDCVFAPAAPAAWAALGEPALDIMKLLAEVTTSDEIFKAWKEH
jgi:nicotinamidase-related amidase